MIFNIFNKLPSSSVERRLACFRLLSPTAQEIRTKQAMVDASQKWKKLIISWWLLTYEDILSATQIDDFDYKIWLKHHNKMRFSWVTDLQINGNLSSTPTRFSFSWEMISHLFLHIAPLPNTKKLITQFSNHRKTDFCRKNISVHVQEIENYSYYAANYFRIPISSIIELLKHLKSPKMSEMCVCRRKKKLL